MVEEVLGQPGVTLLAGAPKVGKSFLALQLALCSGAGYLWLDHPVGKQRVFYLDTHNQPVNIQNRLKGAFANLISKDVLLTHSIRAGQHPNIADTLRFSYSNDYEDVPLIIVDWLATVADSATTKITWDAMVARLRDDALAAEKHLVLVHFTDPRHPLKQFNVWKRMGIVDNLLSLQQDKNGYSLLVQMGEHHERWPLDRTEHGAFIRKRGEREES